MDVAADQPLGRRRDRPLLATFAVVLVLIGSASAIFVGSYNGQRMAGLATRVQQLERAIASAELARVYITQAVFLSAEPGADDTLERTIDAARESLASAASEINAYAALSASSHRQLLELAGDYREVSDRTIDLVRSGSTMPAAAMAVDELEVAYDELREALVDLQRVDALEINQTSSALGRVADVVRFLLAFALPAAGMTVYRWVMNRQRRSAEMRLKLEAEKAINKSKDEFIANVSHELRTPLTGIIGFAQLLEGSALGPDDLDVVRLIVDQSAELGRMVDDLLTAARADANALTIHPREVAISREVTEVIRFVELMRTDVQVAVQDATVVIDPERFRQVLRNLLVNARKHGGSNIKVRGAVKDGSYVCTVIDDGPGVPSHVQERLFSRFVHTGEAPVLMGSVGLGLAIVRELCRLMGCEVAYRRVRGETWFSVTMPLAGAATEAASSALALVPA
ncbi:MAG TPA: ATP-binding protein [Acidimicrobiia bacterium]|nr:ATP-binding protein [Acidimicrobiia bacterium]